MQCGGFEFNGNLMDQKHGVPCQKQKLSDLSFLDLIWMKNF